MMIFLMSGKIQSISQPLAAAPQAPAPRAAGPGTAPVVRLSKTFRFEAAHFLPHMPDGHKCRRMHGHSFIVELICEGALHPQTGVLIDFGEIKEAFDPFLLQLDHHLLNEVEGLANPTSEHIAVWIWKRVSPRLQPLSQVTVHETCTSRCEYRG
jgi:6-pyruvoyltetrahydropterin/6-carboxytetrahydropterin synthase